MPNQKPIIARTTPLSRLLSGSDTHEARYEDGVLTLLDRNGQTSHRVAANHLRTAQISRGRFHNGITVRTTWGKTVQVGGLPKRESSVLSPKGTAMTTETSTLTAALREYRNALSKERASQVATEHSYRPALKTLLETLGGEGTLAVNDPTHVEAGAPDFIVERHGIPIGHVECKDINDNLNGTENSEQLQRYRQGLPNLILTDYMEFRWYVDGEPRGSGSLGNIDNNGHITPDAQGIQKLITLADSFFSADVPTVTSPQDLARRMATKAKILREGISRILSQEKENGQLHRYLQAYRTILISGLTPEDFSDMQAQTFTYGLFAARCRYQSGEGGSFTRQSAVFTNTTPFLQDVFSTIAGPNIDPGIAWIVDDLATLLDRADMATILADFGNRSGDHDPIVHFYEDFLRAYDPRLREMRGVYYTPEPVVSYIVRSIDLLLRNTFGLGDGLADTQTIQIVRPDGSQAESPKVLILDPAAGTGTFLREVVESVRATISEKGMAGVWPDYVKNHLLPRLFGFELLMAPYAVCHLKLAMELSSHDSGFALDDDHDLNVFLTNTLEEPHQPAQGQIVLMSHAIAQESARADAVKRDQPVMVILGNPPYSGHSANKGEWIRNLLRGKDGIESTGNYFQVDGSKLQERNPKWLNDDYVKFIRYAQRRIERTGEGVLGFVTNHSYLDNPTFRGMRQSLMDTFDDIYLLDLHGNSNKKELTPDGGKDENVFDIRQGVAIGLFVKRRGAPIGPAIVHHADLFGERQSESDGKYQWLGANDVGSTNWTLLSPTSPRYLFIPREEDLSDEYESGWSLPIILPVNSAGIVTARDKLAIHWNQDQAMKVVRDFAALPPEEARDKYKVGKDAQDWKVALAQHDLKQSGLKEELLKPVLYRPFDIRQTYYTGKARGFICRPRQDVMRHMLSGDNLGLVTTRQCQNNWDALVTDTIITHKALATYDINSLFPLYTYPTEGQETMGQTREPNINAEFAQAASDSLGLKFTPDEPGDLLSTFGPRDLFYFIYAVLQSPSYRQRYSDFLKSDFAKVPLTGDLNLFTVLVKLGKRMTDLHLLTSEAIPMPSYPEPGTNQVERIRYVPAKGGVPGRVYINQNQYFEGVDQETWGTYIGGYQPADKWLKDRKGMTLTFNDIVHYRRTCAVLAETREIKNQIDQAIEDRGGWPLK